MVRTGGCWLEASGGGLAETKPDQSRTPLHSALAETSCKSFPIQFAELTQIFVRLSVGRSKGRVAVGGGGRVAEWHSPNSCCLAQCHYHWRVNNGNTHACMDPICGIWSGLCWIR